MPCPPASGRRNHQGHRRMDHALQENPRGEIQILRAGIHRRTIRSGTLGRTREKAGMKYVVITSKHHDGFALYDSAVSEWDVMASGAKRDLLTPLAKAVRARDMKFGLYYSQSQDWVHPGGATSGDIGKVWDPAQKGDYDEYLKTIALPQAREIIDRYNPAILWWDTPQQDDARARCPVRGTDGRAPAHHQQQPPRRGLQGRHQHARTTHPATRFPRPNVRGLHDDERHLGLQEERPQTGRARNVSSRCSPTLPARAATCFSTSARAPMARSRRKASTASKPSAAGWMSTARPSMPPRPARSPAACPGAASRKRPEKRRHHPLSPRLGLARRWQNPAAHTQGTSRHRHDAPRRGSRHRRAHRRWHRPPSPRHRHRSRCLRRPPRIPRRAHHHPDNPTTHRLPMVPSPCPPSMPTRTARSAATSASKDRARMPI
jgi:hypothetical protein